MKAARRDGARVHCGSYMSPGWCVGWFPSAKGFFCINPHTGSNYQFRPQARDEYGLWEIMDRRTHV